MKNGFAQLLHPYIQPRVIQPPIMAIHRLSILHYKDECLIQTHPDKVIIEPGELLAISQEKQDEILTSDGQRISRRDILMAAESLFRNSYQNLDVPSPSRSHKRKGDKKGSGSRPKRPSNAFMLYSCSLRKKIRTLIPDYNNSEVSKLLGAMWNSTTMEVKRKFIQEADAERLRHKKQYPDYKYNAKKSSTRVQEKLRRESSQYKMMAKGNRQCLVDSLNNTLSFSVFPEPSVIGNHPNYLDQTGEYPIKDDIESIFFSTDTVAMISHDAVPYEWNDIFATFDAYLPPFPQNEANVDKLVYEGIDAFSFDLSTDLSFESPLI